MDIYNPYYNFDNAPVQSGWIPDQNVQQVYDYQSPYNIQQQNQQEQDAYNQLQQYVANKQQQERKRYSNQYYQIKRGDTLSKIAQVNGITVEQLAKLNGIKDINKIKAGSILRFNDNVKNRYEGIVSRKPKYENTAGIKAMSRTGTRNNGTTLPEVVITAKRPVKQSTNKPQTTAIKNQQQVSNNATNRTNSQNTYSVKSWNSFANADMPAFLKKYENETPERKANREPEKRYKDLIKKPKPTTRLGSEVYNFVRAFGNHYK